MSANVESAVGIFTQFPQGLLFGVDLDLYVNAATGNDNNNGTQASPFQTLSRARTEVYKRPFLNQVRIYLAAGTYTNVDWDGRRFVGNGLQPGRLAFIGLDSSRTVLSSGTVAAGSTVSVMNTPALGGTNNFRGRFVRRYNAGGVFQDERSIIANTANTLSPTAAFMAVPAITDTFEIVQPGVVISGACQFSNFLGVNLFPFTNFYWPSASLFFCNINVLNHSYYNSHVYYKEIESTGSPVLRFNSILDMGFSIAFVGTPINVLGFLGQSTDDEQIRGAGLNTTRVDGPAAGNLIRGFATMNFIFTLSSYTTFSAGDIILYGGCLSGNASASPLLDLEGPGGKVYLTREVANNNRFQLSSTTANTAFRLRPRARDRVYVDNIQFTMSLGDLVQNFGPNAEVEVNNANVGGSTLSGSAFNVRNGAQIVHVGAPTAVGGGGGFDQLISDPVAVNNANAFFAAANTAFTSALGSWIRRAS